MSHGRRSVLASLCLAFAACGVLPDLAIAQRSAPLPAVLVAPAEKRQLARQVEFIGRIEAIEKVELRARVKGFLGPPRFKDGAQVKEGEVLFTIEREPFEAALAQREAQLAAAEATLKNAAAQLGRYQTLASKDVASAAQLDLRIAEEARARAAVLEAKAAIQEAQINLSYTEIKAPISGRIGRANVTQGNLVGPESGVLATIVRQDQVHALFPVTQRQLLDARKLGDARMTVRARLADGSLLPEQGTVDFLDVTVDPRTDGQLARALFPNPNGVLTDGQTVRISIERSGSPDVIAVPLAAVATDQAGQYVYVVDAANTAQQRRVELGATRDGLVAVRKGIEEGERVIVQGLQRVRPGIAVNPQPAAEPKG